MLHVDDKYRLENKNLIYRNLRSRRMAAGLSQSQLAAKMRVWGVDMPQQSISRVERNERYVLDYELAVLCEILHVEPEELLEQNP